MKLRDLILRTDKDTPVSILTDGSTALNLDSDVQAIGMAKDQLIVKLVQKKRMPLWQYAQPGTHPDNVEVR